MTKIMTKYFKHLTRVLKTRESVKLISLNKSLRQIKLSKPLVVLLECNYNFNRNRLLGKQNKLNFKINNRLDFLKNRIKLPETITEG